MKATMMSMLWMALLAPSVHAAEYSRPMADANPDVIRLLAKEGDPAKGKETYGLCRGCHRADASGKAEAGYPQLAGQHATVIMKQMLDVRSGRRDSPRMHPFISDEVVPEEAIAHIAAYLRSLPVPDTNGKGNGRMLALGRQLYQRDCAGCHGKYGEGDGDKFYPRVAGQHEAYLLRESRESRDQGRRNANPGMVRILKGYTDEDLEAVSDYMSRLVPPVP
ncbi:MAG TPA: c-type cytochrome [Thiobacillaceae bacterium]|nr:c-type cytochrome [Thiobacillaceae bacterium]HNU63769.1 c-type cytochrome [Thiobacillaceae bacterium]